MLMPSLLTAPKELEFAALFLGVYMCMGSLTGSLISLCVCIAICCKDLAFSCLVTSPSTDTFFQRSLGKGMPLCAVIIPIKEVTKRCHLISPSCLLASSPWLRFLSTLLSSVLSLVFPLPFITHQETTTKTKPGCLAKWPFYCRIFLSVPFYDDRMANPWRQVPYLSVIYLQDQASFGYLLNIICDTL